MNIPAEQLLALGAQRCDKLKSLVSIASNNLARETQRSPSWINRDHATLPAAASS